MNSFCLNKESLPEGLETNIQYIKVA